MRNSAYSLIVQTSTPFHMRELEGSFLLGFWLSYIHYFKNSFLYPLLCVKKKYGHFHINYGYVCQIVDIYNFSYIHFYVLKYEHSHINYGYACEIVDIYPCASTIRQVSVIVYRPNSMAIQWLTLQQRKSTNDVDSCGWNN